jgi:predicted DNA-binding transcriptional regulator AlpA
VPVARPEVTSRRRLLTTTAPTATVATITTTEPIPTDPLQLLSKQQLAELLGVDPWTIDRWRRPDEPTHIPDFPQPVWVSNATPRWRRVEVEAWLSTRQRGGLSPNWQAHPKPTHKGRGRARDRASQIKDSPRAARENERNDETSK